VGIANPVANFPLGGFRGEFFNLPNHPIFQQPGTTVRTATYGVISGTRLDSRQIQLALKYSF